MPGGEVRPITSPTAPGADLFPALINSVGIATPPGGSVADPARFCAAIHDVLDPLREPEVEMHTTIGHMGNIFSLDGPNIACQTACAASSQAIGEAVELILKAQDKWAGLLADYGA